MAYTLEHGKLRRQTIFYKEIISATITQVDVQCVNQLHMTDLTDIFQKSGDKFVDNLIIQSH